MIYKATLAISLLFLAVASSAQDDGGAYTSGQPSLNISQTATYQPSGTPSPVSIPPTASDGIPSQANSTKTGSCHPWHPALPTSLSSGGPSNTSSPAPKPTFNGTIEHHCHHHHHHHNHSESAIPTMTGYSGGSFPTGNTSFSSTWTYTKSPYGSQSGDFSLPTASPTASSEPSSSGPVDQNPPPSTVTATSNSKLDYL